MKVSKIHGTNYREKNRFESGKFGKLTKICVFKFLMEKSMFTRSATTYIISNKYTKFLIVKNVFKFLRFLLFI